MHSWLAESRSARYAERGRPTTTHSQADRVAQRTLRTRRIAPSQLTDTQRTDRAIAAKVADAHRPTTADLKLARRDAYRK